MSEAKSTKEPRYITTTLPYVNADPHVGFALEMVQADAVARYWRLLGHEVFFNTGTDEHGQKISQKADEAGRDRQEYTDYYAGQFDKLKGALKLSYDSFVRTTDPKHQAAAQQIWKLCDKAGDIYKKKYKGLYCVGCEAFKVESDLVDGKCPDHNKEPEEIEEENYFFKLSNYQTYLEEYLSREGVIVPEFRRQEALNFVKAGLEDTSISREKKRMDWGVPVPGDDEHVMYVWFDALTNYISCLGWPDDAEGKFKKFWVENDTLQFAGKDQVRFQSILWQAMLKSAGIAPTDQVFYHGFINSGGQKMSKSIGNVISPYELVEKYGTDATRYILLRHVHPTDDSDLTWEKMDEYYTANLVNGLGNLTARIMKMAETHLERPVDVPDVTLKDDNDVDLVQLFDSFNFQNALDQIWGGVETMDWYIHFSINEIDEQIQLTQPFKKIKSELSDEVIDAKKEIESLVIQLWYKAKEIAPFMPETSKIIQEAIKANKKPDNLFNRLPE